jgi:hypothetical protein
MGAGLVVQSNFLFGGMVDAGTIPRDDLKPTLSKPILILN